MSQASDLGGGSGVTILTNIVPMEMIDNLVRVIYGDIADNGMRAQSLWQSRHNPFPHLSYCEPVTDIVGFLDSCVPANIGYVIGPHQIVFQPPDDVPEDYELTQHIDVPPKGHAYSLIAGVALNDWHGRNGGPHVWRGSLHESLVVPRASVLFMGPQCPHSPGINRDATPRLGLYVRWAIDDTGDR